MANIYKGTLGLIGNTPLVEVTNILIRPDALKIELR